MQLRKKLKLRIEKDVFKENIDTQIKEVHKKNLNN